VYNEIALKIVPIGAKKAVYCDTLGELILAPEGFT
jgi:hypothetical protein